MTTLEDLFLDAIEDAGNIRTWAAAVDLHEHTEMLVKEFGRHQGRYSAADRLLLMTLRNEVLTKVREVLYRTSIERDVAGTTAERQRHAAERVERLDMLDRELDAAEREREALDRTESRSSPEHEVENSTEHTSAPLRESG